MRIHGPYGAGSASPAAGTRRAGAGGFSLPAMEEAAQTRSSSAARGVAGIDALMALQGVEDATERRRRAVKRGRSALDVLDDLKIGLLSGNLDRQTVQRLKDAASELKMQSGDPGLDSVLAEIELRVEVELAKAGGA